MKSLMPQIDSNDGLFHNGNPATGEQGTRVTDTWLNNLQDRVRDVQAEAHYVLQKAGFQPVENKQTQLYEAIVKIIDDNRKKSSTTQKGEVQLYSGYDSDSEELAATPKVIKILKGFIDSILRSLTNYIPNSKKSSAVNSNSSDTVATSAAVKIVNDNANDRVAKSGDMMTGSLAITGSQSGGFASGLMLKNKAGGPNTSVFVDFYQTDNIPRASMWMRDAGNNSTQIEFLNTPEGANWYIDSRQNVFTITSSGNLWSKAYGWLHELYHKHTNAYVAVTEGGGNIAGLDIRRNDGKSARIELFHKKWKFWIQDKYEIYMPEKGGVVALIEDFTYQKIGNFEVRKYPDGTMIQSYFVDFTDVHGANSGLGGPGPKQLTWAVSFVGKPLVWGNITSSIEDSHDVGVNILTKSTGTTLYWYNYEHSNPNQGACRLQFLAIGRWK